jgi:3D (Asp-Asp-Asp) domain-containing protein
LQLIETLTFATHRFVSAMRPLIRPLLALSIAVLLGVSGCGRGTRNATPQGGGPGGETPSSSNSGDLGAVGGVNGGYDEQVRSTYYYAGEANSDPDTDAGRSSTGVTLQAATATQVGVCAVDPSVIPYGSQVIVQTADGPRYYIAADTGGAVKNETASGGNAHVIDFYSRSQVGGEYQTVTVIPYSGSTSFTNLSASQKNSFFNIGNFPQGGTPNPGGG